eukprot:scaffold53679_cov41-Phaeocystis_antarctica.AAC.1
MRHAAAPAERALRRGVLGVPAAPFSAVAAPAALLALSSATPPPSALSLGGLYRDPPGCLRLSTLRLRLSSPMRRRLPSVEGTAAPSAPSVSDPAVSGCLAGPSPKPPVSARETWQSQLWAHSTRASGRAGLKTMRETTSGLPAMAGNGTALRALHGARQPRSTSKRVSCLGYGLG